MRFAVGAAVFVTTLGKHGTVVEVANGRYRVAVGPVTTWCGEDDVASKSEGKKKAKRDREAGQAGATATGSVGLVSHEPSVGERRALASLDLHGLTVEEALQAVGLRLDAAIRAGLDRIEIIHGISGGRLRAAVRGLLAGVASVKRFEPDPRNPGVTIVYL